MTAPEYTVHNGEHNLPENVLQAVLQTVEIEKKYDLDTEIVRRIWCNKCEKHATVVYADGTFTSLTDCKGAD